MTDQATVHAQVGGDAFFVDLVRDFYDAVETDPVLRPLYPPDLTDPRRRLTGFLIQYWGGASAYSEERGHPRLRMRHQPFAIGPAERDAWLQHMLVALERREAPEAIRRLIVDYFVRSADFLRNDE